MQPTTYFDFHYQFQTKEAESKAAAMAMNPRPAPQAYQDFEPPTEWAHEPKWDTLIVHLPGFRPERLKVQVTSDGKLRISGENYVGENKWRRFLTEFPIPSNCDTTRITAKYDGGVLYVRQPKMIVPVEPKENAIKPPEEARSQTEEQQKKNDQQYSKPPNDTAPEKSAKKENDQSGAKSSASDNDNKESGKELRDENTESNKERHEMADEKLADGNRDSYEKGIKRAGSYRKVAGDLVMEMKKQRNLVNMAIVVLLILILFLYPSKTTNSLGDSAD